MNIILKDVEKNKRTFQNRKVLSRKIFFSNRENRKKNRAKVKQVAHGASRRAIIVSFEIRPVN